MEPPHGKRFTLLQASPSDDRGPADESRVLVSWPAFSRAFLHNWRVEQQMLIPESGRKSSTTINDYHDAVLRVKGQRQRQQPQNTVPDVPDAFDVLARHDLFATRNRVTARHVRFLADRIGGDRNPSVDKTAVVKIIHHIWHYVEPESVLAPPKTIVDLAVVLCVGAGSSKSTVEKDRLCVTLPYVWERRELLLTVAEIGAGYGPGGQQEYKNREKTGGGDRNMLLEALAFHLEKLADIMLKAGSAHEMRAVERSRATEESLKKRNIFEGMAGVEKGMGVCSPERRGDGVDQIVWAGDARARDVGSPLSYRTDPFAHGVGAEDGAVENGSAKKLGGESPAARGSVPRSPESSPVRKSLTPPLAAPTGAAPRIITATFNAAPRIITATFNLRLHNLHPTTATPAGRPFQYAGLFFVRSATSGAAPVPFSGRLLGSCAAGGSTSSSGAKEKERPAVPISLHECPFQLVVERGFDLYLAPQHVLDARLQPNLGTGSRKELVLQKVGTTIKDHVLAVLIRYIDISS